MSPHEADAKSATARLNRVNCSRAREQIGPPIDAYIHRSALLAFKISTDSGTARLHPPSGPDPWQPRRDLPPSHSRCRHRKSSARWPAQCRYRRTGKPCGTLLASSCQIRVFSCWPPARLQSSLAGTPAEPPVKPPHSAVAPGSMALRQRLRGHSFG